MKAMNKQEYDQQKRECWEEFCQHIVDEEEAFYNMFGRAYALGKEVGQKGRPLYTYITDDDKENVRAEYNSMVKAYESPRNSGEKEYAKGYMEALEWLFGIRFLTNQQNDNE